MVARYQCSLTSNYPCSVVRVDIDGIYRITDRNIEKEPATTLNVASIESIDGVLWALSENALMRFDGHVWETFKHVDN